MTLAKTLNLVPVVKPETRNPIVSRRQRLLTAIDKQIATITVTVDGGDLSTVTPGRKTPAWYWMDEGGNYFVSIKYGKKPVEIGKGKYSIQCESLREIIDALKIVKEHVIRGELDSQLTTLAKSIRRNFGKN